MANRFKITKLDPQESKNDLIEFIQQNPEFSDIDYEGSTINMIVDLLEYNASKTAVMANMVANESFMRSAQLRRNVVSHAQKHSYTPKTVTASRMICDVEVIPASTANLPNSIVMEPGTQFITSGENNTFTFVNTESYVLTFSNSRGSFFKSDVELFQGQLISDNFTYQGVRFTIPNENCDSSTLTVQTDSEEGGIRTYTLPDNVSQLGGSQAVYFIGESKNGEVQIEFGQDVLGREPTIGSDVTVSYIAAEEEHANGASTLVAGSTISGYSNITATVTTPAYGGSDREDIERIRFVAPKLNQAQYRALTASDYIPIIKAQFPFVRSAISWGGERNNPKRYGTVFVSILSDQGLITNAVKERIRLYVAERNVGSVTPEIVEPEEFGINMIVSFFYDKRLTSKSFNDLSSEIIAVVNEYNMELNDFEQFFNESEIVSRIKEQVNGVVTVTVSKKIFKDVPLLSIQNAVYSANFNNHIIPGTFMGDGFNVVSTGSEQKMFDDENGNIIFSYVVSGETTELEIGNIDYETGAVEFTLSIASVDKEDGTFRIECELEGDNIYVEQNRVLYIEDTQTELISINTRDR